LALLSVSSDFLDFLEALSKKPDGESLCFYQQDLDFLYVICGEGSCSDWNRLSIGKIIFEGVDIIEKVHPEDFTANNDSFAGLEIWGGVQNFLSHNYKRVLSDRYEKYRLQHNAHALPTPVSEIIDFLVADKRGLSRPLWSIWQERVTKALAEQSPEVHIPILHL